MQGPWQQQTNQLISEHFAAARERVEPFADSYLLSPRAVLQRHWQCRGDIPRDLANLPRSLWRMGCKLARRPAPAAASPSRKAELMAALVLHELLMLGELEQQLLEHIRQHPAFCVSKLQAVQAELSLYSPSEAQEKVHQALDRLRLTHEGSRDAVVFLLLGAVGKSISQQVAFGSAAGVGISVASGLYISQQTTLGALWSSWLGVPTWVATSGAVAGVAGMIVLTPVLSPLFEIGLSRLRSKKVLHQLIDQTEHRVRGDQHDAGSLAGLAGTYLQLMPDLLQALRALR